MAHTCPRCEVQLRVIGWHVPGMRCLAELDCSRCGAGFYSDLPSGQGLYTPMLLERETGVVHDRYGVEWFAGWLRDSFANRTNVPLGFGVRPSEDSQHTKRSTHGAVLLNCLDTLYGHSLLKLLNAQYYLDAHPELDLLVLIPAALAWMVPAGVRQTWLVDMPWSRGTEWNESLAAEIRRRVESYDECYLSLAFSHPSACDFAIERFTRTAPFPLEEWEERMAEPTVTFIWRDDRSWGDQQQNRVLEVAQLLHRTWPEINFTVVGLGRAGGLPSWIRDERRLEIDETTERRWCACYSRSHVVVGVHGSNMLLPSAHAGATVELVPPERWGNVLQDLVVPADDADARAALFRRRLLPLSSSPEEVAHIVACIMRLDAGMRRLMTREFTQHGVVSETSKWRFPERDAR